MNTKEQNLNQVKTFKEKENNIKASSQLNNYDSNKENNINSSNINSLDGRTEIELKKSKCQPTYNNTSMISMLSAISENVFNKNNNIVQWPLLFHTIIKGTVKDTKKALKKGENPNLQLEFGETPLSQAVELDKYDHAQLLLQSSADPNLSNKDGMTPLHLAVIKKNSEIVKLLLSNGASANVKNRVYNQTPLHLCIISKSTVEILYHLIHYGANPNIYDYYGKKPFDYVTKDMKDLKTAIEKFKLGYFQNNIQNNSSLNFQVCDKSNSLIKDDNSNFNSKTRNKVQDNDKSKSKQNANSSKSKLDQNALRLNMSDLDNNNSVVYKGVQTTNRSMLSNKSSKSNLTHIKHDPNLPSKFKADKNVRFSPRTVNTKNYSLLKPGQAQVKSTNTLLNLTCDSHLINPIEESRNYNYNNLATPTSNINKDFSVTNAFIDGNESLIQGYNTIQTINTNQSFNNNNGNVTGLGLNTLVGFNINSVNNTFENIPNDISELNYLNEINNREASVREIIKEDSIYTSYYVSTNNHVQHQDNNDKSNNNICVNIPNSSMYNFSRLTMNSSEKKKQDNQSLSNTPSDNSSPLGTDGKSIINNNGLIPANNSQFNLNFNIMSYSVYNNNNNNNNSHFENNDRKKYETGIGNLRLDLSNSYCNCNEFINNSNVNVNNPNEANTYYSINNDPLTVKNLNVIHKPGNSKINIKYTHNVDDELLSSQDSLNSNTYVNPNLVNLDYSKTQIDINEQTINKSVLKNSESMLRTTENKNILSYSKSSRKQSRSIELFDESLLISSCTENIKARNSNLSKHSKNKSNNKSINKSRKKSKNIISDMSTCKKNLFDMNQLCSKPNLTENSNSNINGKSTIEVNFINENCIGNFKPDKKRSKSDIPENLISKHNKHSKQSSVSSNANANINTIRNNLNPSTVKKISYHKQKKSVTDYNPLDVISKLIGHNNLLDDQFRNHLDQINTVLIDGGNINGDFLSNNLNQSNNKQELEKNSRLASFGNYDMLIKNNENNLNNQLSIIREENILNEIAIKNNENKFSLFNLPSKDSNETSKTNKDSSKSENTNDEIQGRKKIRLVNRSSRRSNSFSINASSHFPHNLNIKKHDSTSQYSNSGYLSHFNNALVNEGNLNSSNPVYCSFGKNTSLNSSNIKENDNSNKILNLKHQNNKLNNLCNFNKISSTDSLHKVDEKSCNEFFLKDSCNKQLSFSLNSNNNNIKNFNENEMFNKNKPVNNQNYNDSCNNNPKAPSFSFKKANAFRQSSNINSTRHTSINRYDTNYDSNNPSIHNQKEVKDIREVENYSNNNCAEKQDKDVNSKCPSNNTSSNKLKSVKGRAKVHRQISELDNPNYDNTNKLLSPIPSDNNNTNVIKNNSNVSNSISEVNNSEINITPYCANESFEKLSKINDYVYDEIDEPIPLAPLLSSRNNEIRGKVKNKNIYLQEQSSASQNNSNNNPLPQRFSDVQPRASDPQSTKNKNKLEGKLESRQVNRFVNSNTNNNNTNNDWLEEVDYDSIHLNQSYQYADLASQTVFDTVGDLQGPESYRSRAVKNNFNGNISNFNNFNNSNLNISAIPMKKSSDQPFQLNNSEIVEIDENLQPISNQSKKVAKGKMIEESIKNADAELFKQQDYYNNYFSNLNRNRTYKISDNDYKTAYDDNDENYEITINESFNKNESSNNKEVILENLHKSLKLNKENYAEINKQYPVVNKNRSNNNNNEVNNPKVKSTYNKNSKIASDCNRKTLELANWLTEINLQQYFNTLVSRNLYDLEELKIMTRNNFFSEISTLKSITGIEYDGHALRFLTRLKIDSGEYEKIKHVVEMILTMNNNSSNNSRLGNSLKNSMFQSKLNISKQITCCGMGNFFDFDIFGGNNFALHQRTPSKIQKEKFKHYTCLEAWLKKGEIDTRMEANFSANGFDFLEYFILLLFSDIVVDRNFIKKHLQIYHEDYINQILKFFAQEKEFLTKEAEIKFNIVINSKQKDSKNNNNPDEVFDNQSRINDRSAIEDYRRKNSKKLVNIVEDSSSINPGCNACSIF